MPTATKRRPQAVVTARALERQALHELDDGRLVREGDDRRLVGRP